MGAAGDADAGAWSLVWSSSSGRESSSSGASHRPSIRYRLYFIMPNFAFSFFKIYTALNSKFKILRGVFI